MKFCMECGSGMAHVELDGRERLRCGSCGWTLYEDPKLAVAVIVADHDSVLLGRRGYGVAHGLWSFPAGFVDRGEKLEDAAVREVHEETGLKVDLGPLFALLSHDGDPVVLAVYPARVRNGVLSPGPEMTELHWFKEGEMPEMAFEHDAELLRSWWNQRKTDKCVL